MGSHSDERLKRVCQGSNSTGKWEMGNAYEFPTVCFPSRDLLGIVR